MDYILNIKNVEKELFPIKGYSEKPEKADERIMKLKETRCLGKENSIGIKR